MKLRVLWSMASWALSIVEGLSVSQWRCNAVTVTSAISVNASGV
ncbi:MAG: hypothetical protein Q8Q50_14045 [Methylobacter sp.]|nr:hypothetical protein [Methylobacter sp.]